MDRAWKEIDKHLGRQGKDSRMQWYPKIWREVWGALHRSRKQPIPRIKKRDQFIRIQAAAVELGGMITEVANGLLDCHAYEYFSENDARIAFKVPAWSSLSSEQKSDIAHGLLPHWPLLATC
jgi:hypothetical protein